MRVRKMVAITKALDRAVAKVTIASMAEMEICRLKGIASSQDSRVVGLTVALMRKNSSELLNRSMLHGSPVLYIIYA